MIGYAQRFGSKAADIVWKFRCPKHPAEKWTPINTERPEIWTGHCEVCGAQIGTAP